MRVFLDENVDLKLKDHLQGHAVESISSMGWFGISNGELLSRIEQSFDVLISHDKGLQYQQNWTGRKLRLVLILSMSTEFASYAHTIDEIRESAASATTSIFKVEDREK